jgi:hypothetical protein
MSSAIPKLCEDLIFSGLKTHPNLYIIYINQEPKKKKWQEKAKQKFYPKLNLND